MRLNMLNPQTVARFWDYSAGNKHVMVEHKLFQELETFLVATCTSNIFLNKAWSQSHWIRNSSPKCVVEHSPFFNRHVFGRHVSDLLTCIFTQTFHLNRVSKDFKSRYVSHTTLSHGCSLDSKLPWTKELGACGHLEWLVPLVMHSQARNLHPGLGFLTASKTQVHIIDCNEHFSIQVALICE